MKLQEGGENWITRSLMICTLQQVHIIRMIKSRRIRWARHVAQMGEQRNVYMLLVGKSEGKTLLGRPRRRWVVNINMDLLEIGWGGVTWIGLAQDWDKWRALVNEVMNLWVP
jgi:hypothetical protein